ncbi:MAG: hypothetical protein KA760_11810 [Steroidobacteraceae bacterium]|nr:hypothetical protein [Steroidobacteraceae bacterium]
MSKYSVEELSNMLEAEVIHWDMLSLSEADAVQEHRASRDAAYDRWVETQFEAQQALFEIDFA